ncbi:transposase family protein, partial [bacterium]|nr:transposase family protein [bacterium]
AWKTRKDPLAAIWPKAQAMLGEAPELEAKALFEHLMCGVPPGEVEEKHLRTFQRRVKDWRLTNGPGKEVFFTQEQTPGKVLAMDWTDMGSVGITIRGRALKHKLFHAVLPYSNWEWAVRAHSESTLSLRAGLKAVLGRLGRVPQELLSDHSSTATHQLKRGSGERGLNQEYLSICAHYGITPRTINVGRPQENGSCETSHGHLKRRIRQHLLLRGSADFKSEEEYDGFLVRVLESANLRRAKRLGEELAAMPETLIADLADYRELMVSVRNDSTIRVNKMVYSVPCRLIGVKLLARIGENGIVLLAGAREVARLPLSRGDRGAVIDFRHLIGHLLRKPGAFAGYRWREELFPSTVYRAAYDHLERAGGAADKRYLEILKLAADEGQTAVENALEQLLATPRGVVSAKHVREVLEAWRDLEREWRERPPLPVSLSIYDALLDGGEESECVLEEVVA